MTHGSLFSGIGGFDLAAEWMGWHNLFHCEWNSFGQRVLNHYWPEAELFTDITESNFTTYANRIDVLSGGFPCQPYSLAGKRLGKEDERHLWPEMLRAVREIKPRYIVGENVFGLVNWNGGLVFNEVQADLEAEGYEVQPYILPACGVNAPHRRDRVWFVAYAGGKRKWQLQTTGTGHQDAQIGSENTCGFIQHVQDGVTADTNSQRHEKSQSATFTDRPERQYSETGFTGQPPGWQNFPTQSPVRCRNDGLPGGLDGITFSKWRNESIKAFGNAVVPQIVYMIFKSIQTHHDTLNHTKT